MEARANPRERRQFVRYALTGELPGRLTNAAGMSFNVVTVDVSRRGMGLLLDPAPEENEKLVLTLEGPRGGNILFEVRWSAVHHEFDSLPGLSSMRRCGLMVVDRKIDLVTVLAKYDCVQIEE